MRVSGEMTLHLDRGNGHVEQLQDAVAHWGRGFISVQLTP